MSHNCHLSGKPTLEAELRPDPPVTSQVPWGGSRCPGPACRLGPQRPQLQEVTEVPKPHQRLSAHPPGPCEARVNNGWERIGTITQDGGGGGGGGGEVTSSKWAWGLGRELVPDVPQASWSGQLNCDP
jgi:hypothetical protein